MCKLTVMRCMQQSTSNQKSNSMSWDPAVQVPHPSWIKNPNLCPRACAHLQQRQPHAVSVWPAPESAEGAAVTYLHAAVQSLQYAVPAQTRLPIVGQNICVTMQSWILLRDVLWLSSHNMEASKLGSFKLWTQTHLPNAFGLLCHTGECKLQNITISLETLWAKHEAKQDSWAHHQLKGWVQPEMQ